MRLRWTVAATIVRFPTHGAATGSTNVNTLMDVSGFQLHSDRRPVVGRFLLRHCEENQWSDEELAGYLGCGATGLAELALSRCPPGEDHDYAAWAGALEARTGCIPGRLLTILDLRGCGVR